MSVDLFMASETSGFHARSAYREHAQGGEQMED